MVPGTHLGAPVPTPPARRAAGVLRRELARAVPVVDRGEPATVPHRAGALAQRGRLGRWRAVRGRGRAAAQSRRSPARARRRVQGACAIRRWAARPTRAEVRTSRSSRAGWSVTAGRGCNNRARSSATPAHASNTSSTSRRSGRRCRRTLDAGAICGSTPTASWNGTAPGTSGAPSLRRVATNRARISGVSTGSIGRRPAICCSRARARSTCARRAALDAPDPWTVARELVDLSSLIFEPREAPAEARRWTGP